MQLYLLRHGPAGTRDSGRFPDDDKRPLTPHGKARTEAAARGMEAAGFRFDLVLTSPLARARQTAGIVAGVIPKCPRPRLLGALAPGGTTAGVLAGIPAGPSSRQILLVGHEPDLTNLAAGLVSPGAAHLAMVLRKGGLIRIDFDGPPLPSAGHLILLMTPKLLRRL